MATVFIRDYREGECLPDYHTGSYYTADELHNAVFIESDDITGAETYRLSDYRIVTLYSIDLNWDNNTNEVTVIKTTEGKQQ